MKMYEADIHHRHLFILSVNNKYINEIHMQTDIRTGRLIQYELSHLTELFVLYALRYVNL